MKCEAGTFLELLRFGDRLGEIEQTLCRHTKLLNKLLRMEKREIAKIDDVAAAVADETTVVASAVTLLGQLHDMIVAAGTDPVKLDAVIAAIAANKQTLADAVVANTPAA